MSSDRQQPNHQNSIDEYQDFKHALSQINQRLLRLASNVSSIHIQQEETPKMGQNENQQQWNTNTTFQNQSQTKHISFSVAHMKQSESEFLQNRCQSVNCVRQKTKSGIENNPMKKYLKKTEEQNKSQVYIPRLNLNKLKNVQNENVEPETFGKPAQQAQFKLNQLKQPKLLQYVQVANPQPQKIVMRQQKYYQPRSISPLKPSNIQVMVENLKHVNMYQIRQHSKSIY